MTATANQPQTKTFEPKGPVVFTGGNPAKDLTSRERAKLLSVFNQTRKGEKSFVVEVTYVKQTNAENRLAPQDFQPVPGTPRQTHVGLIVKAEKSANGDFYITLADHNRCDAGKIGYTSMRLSGLKSFKVLKTVPGLAIIDII